MWFISVTFKQNDLINPNSNGYYISWNFFSLQIITLKLISCLHLKADCDIEIFLSIYLSPVGAVEYAEYVSAEGKTPSPTEYPVYGTTDGEAWRDVKHPHRVPLRPEW